MTTTHFHKPDNLLTLKVTGDKAIFLDNSRETPLSRAISLKTAKPEALLLWVIVKRDSLSCIHNNFNLYKFVGRLIQINI